MTTDTSGAGEPRKGGAPLGRIQCNNCGRFGDDEDLNGQVCGLELPTTKRACHGLMIRQKPKPAAEAGGWVSCIASYPDEEAFGWSPAVQCFTNEPDEEPQFVGAFSHILNEWQECGSNRVRLVTHWRPLPEGPKKPAPPASEETKR